MERMRIQDTDDAVSGVMALRQVLSSELGTIERLIRRADRTPAAGNEEAQELMDTYDRVRTSLLSGLASVDEVLGWVHMLAEKDSDGNELECVRTLPYVNVLPRN